MNAADAKVKALLEGRLLARQARFGGSLATAADLQPGDRFLTGAAGPGAEVPVEVETVKVVHGVTKAYVLYRGVGALKAHWLPGSSMVLVLTPEQP